MFETQKINLILASSSQTRADLLENTGLSFEIVPPRVDEAIIKQVFDLQATDPDDIANVLAQAKAQDISKIRPDSLVIGGDQILVLSGQNEGLEIFEKPKNKEEAYKTLFKLRGKTHQLISAISLVKNEEVIWTHSETANLTMREFTPEFLGNYIAHCSDDILSSVGAYQLESFGIHLFEEIKGDYFTILGFPIIALLAKLRDEGYISS